MGWDSLMDSQRSHSQKEGQEDQGTLKQLEGGSPSSLISLGDNLRGGEPCKKFNGRIRNKGK